MCKSESVRVWRNYRLIRLLYLLNVKMTVKELIERLNQLDVDKNIYFVDSEYWYSCGIKKIEENCIFKYKSRNGWSNYEKWQIFCWEWYHRYERVKKEEDGIVEYEDCYLITD